MLTDEELSKIEERNYQQGYSQDETPCVIGMLIAELRKTREQLEFQKKTNYAITNAEWPEKPQPHAMSIEEFDRDRLVVFDVKCRKFDLGHKLGVAITCYPESELQKATEHHDRIKKDWDRIPEWLDKRGVAKYRHAHIWTLPMTSANLIAVARTLGKWLNKRRVESEWEKRTRPNDPTGEKHRV